MSNKRVWFCGVIQGSVAIRPGETSVEAIARAEEALLELMGRRAKRFSDDGTGPNLSLEVNDNT